MAAAAGRLGSQPPRVDPPVVPATVTVKALRDHYSPGGMVLEGATSVRSADDAAYLLAQGVVEIVGAVKAKR